MVKKLFFLPAGSCFLDQSAVNRNFPSGKLVEMPVWCFLLETNDGPVLVDTGMPDSFVNNPDYYKGTRREGRLVPQMTEADKIENILKRVGYHTGDLRTVISSHLHLDHTGGNGYFRNVPIVIQKTEFDAAIGNDDYSPRECRIPDLQYQLIEGDYELAPGIQLLYTPGHSPGHQSVLVKTERTGYILLTIDLAYTQEIFDHDISFLSSDADMASRSILSMKKLIQQIQPAVVFFGHDLKQAKNWQTYYPDFL
jgi:N-acyl homoserine lactone hydrolase